MRKLITIIATGLAITACNNAEKTVSIPSGTGSWVLIKEDQLANSGEAILFSRNAMGKETRVEATYSTQRINFGSTQINLAASCGELSFLKVLDEVSFWGDIKTKYKEGAVKCGFGDRLSSPWKVVSAFPKSTS